jgi:20S proteasome alpha/beta subunit
VGALSKAEPHHGMSIVRKASTYSRATKTFVVSIWLLASFLGTPVRSALRLAPLRVKGSFVIAAICKDGIIVASDSRGMLKDREGRRIAYYDVNQKIFPIANNLIADTGYASLSDARISFLSALMSRFGQNPVSRVAVDQLPASYFSYADSILGEAGAQSARVQTLVFAGYKQEKPILCMYEGESSGTTRCRFSGYFSSPRGEIFGLQNVSSLSFAEAAQVMEKTINDYAAAVQPGLVGGPVVMRIITRSGSKWFRSRPDWPNWESFTDLADDYRKSRVPFHLMPGISKVQLDEVIDDGADWARELRRSNSEKPDVNAPVIGSHSPDR